MAWTRHVPAQARELYGAVSDAGNTAKRAGRYALGILGSNPYRAALGAATAAGMIAGAVSDRPVAVAGENALSPHTISAAEICQHEVDGCNRVYGFDPEWGWQIFTPETPASSPLQTIEAGKGYFRHTDGGGWKPFSYNPLGVPASPLKQAVPVLEAIDAGNVRLYLPDGKGDFRLAYSHDGKTGISMIPQETMIRPGEAAWIWVDKDVELPRGLEKIPGSLKAGWNLPATTSFIFYNDSSSASTPVIIPTPSPYHVATSTPTPTAAPTRTPTPAATAIPAATATATATPLRTPTPLATSPATPTPQNFFIWKPQCSDSPDAIVSSGVLTPEEAYIFFTKESKIVDATGTYKFRLLDSSGNVITSGEGNLACDNLASSRIPFGQRVTVPFTFKVDYTSTAGAKLSAEQAYTPPPVFTLPTRTPGLTPIALTPIPMARLSTQLTGPSVLKPGGSAEYSAVVNNNGAADADKFTLRTSCGTGISVETNVNERIPSGGSRAEKFTCTFDANGMYVVSAEAQAPAQNLRWAALRPVFAVAPTEQTLIRTGNVFKMSDGTVVDYVSGEVDPNLVFRAYSPGIGGEYPIFGRRLEVPYSGGNGKIAAISLGGKSYDVFAGDTTTPNFPIQVDMNGDGVLGGDVNVRNLAGGLYEDRVMRGGVMMPLSTALEGDRIIKEREQQKRMKILV